MDLQEYYNQQRGRGPSQMDPMAPHQHPQASNEQQVRQALEFWSGFSSRMASRNLPPASKEAEIRSVAGLFQLEKSNRRAADFSVQGSPVPGAQGHSTQELAAVKAVLSDPGVCHTFIGAAITPLMQLLPLARDTGTGKGGSEEKQSLRSAILLLLANMPVDSAARLHPSPLLRAGMDGLSQNDSEVNGMLCAALLNGVICTLHPDSPQLAPHVDAILQTLALVLRGLPKAVERCGALQPSASASSLDASVSMTPEPQASSGLLEAGPVPCHESLRVFESMVSVAGNMLTLLIANPSNDPRVAELHKRIQRAALQDMCIPLLTHRPLPPHHLTPLSAFRLYTLTLVLLSKCRQGNTELWSAALQRHGESIVHMLIFLLRGCPPSPYGLRAALIDAVDKLLMDTALLETALAPKMAELLGRRPIEGPSPADTSVWLRSKTLHLVIRLLMHRSHVCSTMPPVAAARAMVLLSHAMQDVTLSLADHKRALQALCHVAASRLEKLWDSGIQAEGRSEQEAQADAHRLLSRVLLPGLTSRLKALRDRDIPAIEHHLKRQPQGGPSNSGAPFGVEGEPVHPDVVMVFGANAGYHSNSQNSADHVGCFFALLTSLTTTLPHHLFPLLGRNPQPPISAASPQHTPRRLSRDEGMQLSKYWRRSLQCLHLLLTIPATRQLARERLDRHALHNFARVLGHVDPHVVGHYLLGPQMPLLIRSISETHELHVLIYSLMVPPLHRLGPVTTVAFLDHLTSTLLTAGLNEDPTQPALPSAPQSAKERRALVLVYMNMPKGISMAMRQDQALSHAFEETLLVYAKRLLLSPLLGCSGSLQSLPPEERWWLPLFALRTAISLLVAQGPSSNAATLLRGLCPLIQSSLFQLQGRTAALSPVVPLPTPDEKPGRLRATNSTLESVSSSLLIYLQRHVRSNHGGATNPPAPALLLPLALACLRSGQWDISKQALEAIEQSVDSQREDLLRLLRCQPQVTAELFAHLTAQLDSRAGELSSAALCVLGKLGGDGRDLAFESNLLPQAYRQMLSHDHFAWIRHLPRPPSTARTPDASIDGEMEAPSNSDDPLTVSLPGSHLFAGPSTGEAAVSIPLRACVDRAVDLLALLASPEDPRVAEPLIQQADANGPPVVSKSPINAALTSAEAATLQQQVIDVAQHHKAQAWSFLLACLARLTTPEPPPQQQTEDSMDVDNQQGQQSPAPEACVHNLLQAPPPTVLPEPDRPGDVAKAIKGCGNATAVNRALRRVLFGLLAGASDRHLQLHHQARKLLSALCTDCLHRSSARHTVAPAMESAHGSVVMQRWADEDAERLLTTLPSLLLPSSPSGLGPLSLHVAAQSGPLPLDTLLCDALCACLLDPRPSIRASAEYTLHQQLFPQARFLSMLPPPTLPLPPQSALPFFDTLITCLLRALLSASHSLSARLNLASSLCDVLLHLGAPWALYYEPLAIPSLLFLLHGQPTDQPPANATRDVIRHVLTLLDLCHPAAADEASIAVGRVMVRMLALEMLLHPTHAAVRIAARVALRHLLLVHKAEDMGSEQDGGWVLETLRDSANTILLPRLLPRPSGSGPQGADAQAGQQGAAMSISPVSSPRSSPLNTPRSGGTAKGAALVGALDTLAFLLSPSPTNGPLVDLGGEEGEGRVAQLWTLVHEASLRIVIQQEGAEEQGEQTLHNQIPRGHAEPALRPMPILDEAGGYGYVSRHLQGGEERRKWWEGEVGAVFEAGEMPTLEQRIRHQAFRVVRAMVQATPEAALRPRLVSAFVPSLLHRCFTNIRSSEPSLVHSALSTLATLGRHSSLLLPPPTGETEDTISSPPLLALMHSQRFSGYFAVWSPNPAPLPTAASTPRPSASPTNIFTTRGLQRTLLGLSLLGAQAQRHLIPMYSLPRQLLHHIQQLIDPSPAPPSTSTSTPDNPPPPPVLGIRTIHDAAALLNAFHFLPFSPHPPPSTGVLTSQLLEPLVTLTLRLHARVASQPPMCCTVAPGAPPHVRALGRFLARCVRDEEQGDQVLGYFLQVPHLLDLPCFELLCDLLTLDGEDADVSRVLRGHLMTQAGGHHISAFCLALRKPNPKTLDKDLLPQPLLWGPSGPCGQPYVKAEELTKAKSGLDTNLLVNRGLRIIHLLCRHEPTYPDAASVIPEAVRHLWNYYTQPAKEREKEKDPQSNDLLDASPTTLFDGPTLCKEENAGLLLRCQAAMFRQNVEKEGRLLDVVYGVLKLQRQSDMGMLGQRPAYLLELANFLTKMWRLPLGSPGSPSLSCRARLFTGWLEPLHKLKQADEGKRRLEMLLASGALRVLIRPMLLWTHAHDRASIVQVLPLDVLYKMAKPGGVLNKDTLETWSVPLQLDLLDLLVLLFKILPRSVLEDKSEDPRLMVHLRITARFVAAYTASSPPAPGRQVDEHVKQEGQLVLAHSMIALPSLRRADDAFKLMRRLMALPTPEVPQGNFQSLDLYKDVTINGALVPLLQCLLGHAPDRLPQDAQRSLAEHLGRCLLDPSKSAANAASLRVLAAWGPRSDVITYPLRSVLLPSLTKFLWQLYHLIVQASQGLSGQSLEPLVNRVTMLVKLLVLWEEEHVAAKLNPPEPQGVVRGRAESGGGGAEKRQRIGSPSQPQHIPALQPSGSASTFTSGRSGGGSSGHTSTDVGEEEGEEQSIAPSLSTLSHDGPSQPHGMPPSMSVSAVFALGLLSLAMCESCRRWYEALDEFKKRELRFKAMRPDEAGYKQLQAEMQHYTAQGVKHKRMTITLEGLFVHAVGARGQMGTGPDLEIKHFEGILKRYLRYAFVEGAMPQPSITQLPPPIPQYTHGQQPVHPQQPVYGHPQAPMHHPTQSFRISTQGYSEQPAPLLEPVAMYEMRVMAPLLDALSESLELVQGPQRQSLYIVRHINLVLGVILASLPPNYQRLGSFPEHENVEETALVAGHIHSLLRRLVTAYPPEQPQNLPPTFVACSFYGRIEERIRTELTKLSKPQRAQGEHAFNDRVHGHVPRLLQLLHMPTLFPSPHPSLALLALPAFSALLLIAQRADHSGTFNLQRDEDLIAELQPRRPAYGPTPTCPLLERTVASATAPPPPSKDFVKTARESVQKGGYLCVSAGTLRAILALLCNLYMHPHALSHDVAKALQGSRYCVVAVLHSVLKKALRTELLRDVMRLVEKWLISPLQAEASNRPAEETERTSLFEALLARRTEDYASLSRILTAASPLLPSAPNTWRMSEELALKAGLRGLMCPDPELRRTFADRLAKQLLASLQPAAGEQAPACQTPTLLGSVLSLKWTILQHDLFQPFLPVPLMDLLLSCVLQHQDTSSGMDVDIPTSLPQQAATLPSLLTPFQRPESLLLPITHLLHADPPLAALLLHPVMSALYTRLGPLQQAGLVTHMSALLSSGALLGSGSAAPVPLPVYLQPAFQLSRAESSCPPAHLSGGGLKVSNGEALLRAFLTLRPLPVGLPADLLGALAIACKSWGQVVAFLEYRVANGDVEDRLSCLPVLQRLYAHMGAHAESYALQHRYYHHYSLPSPTAPNAAGPFVQPARHALSLHAWGHNDLAATEFRNLLALASPGGEHSGVSLRHSKPKASNAELLLWEQRWLACTRQLSKWPDLLDLMEDGFPERSPSAMLEVAWKGQLFNTWDSSGLWWRLPEQAWYNRDRQPSAISGFDAYTSRPLTLLYKFRHELVQRIQTGQFPLPTHLSKLAVEQVRYLTECWRQQLPSNGPMQPLGRYTETTHAMQVLTELQEVTKYHMALKQQRDAQAAASGAGKPGGASGQLRHLVKFTQSFFHRWEARNPRPWEPMAWWDDLAILRSLAFRGFEAPLLHALPSEVVSLFDRLRHASRVRSLLALERAQREHGALMAALSTLDHVLMEEAGILTTTPNYAVQVILEKVLVFKGLQNREHALTILDATNTSHLTEPQQAALHLLRAHLLHPIKPQGALSAAMLATQMHESAATWGLWARVCDTLLEADGGPQQRNSTAANAITAYLRAIHMTSVSKADALHGVSNPIAPHLLLPRVLHLLRIEEEDRQHTLPPSPTQQAQEGDDVGGTCAKALQKEGKHLPAWVWLPWAPSFILHHRQQYHCIAPFQDILLNVLSTYPQALYPHLRLALQMQQRLPPSPRISSLLDTLHRHALQTHPAMVACHTSFAQSMRQFVRLKISSDPTHAERDVYVRLQTCLAYVLQNAQSTLLPPPHAPTPQLARLAQAARTLRDKLAQHNDPPLLSAFTRDWGPLLAYNTEEGAHAEPPTFHRAMCVLHKWMQLLRARLALGLSTPPSTPSSLAPLPALLSPLRQEPTAHIRHLWKTTTCPPFTGLEVPGQYASCPAQPYPEAHERIVGVEWAQGPPVVRDQRLHWRVYLQGSGGRRHAFLVSQSDSAAASPKPAQAIIASARGQAMCWVLARLLEHSATQHRHAHQPFHRLGLVPPQCPLDGGLRLLPQGPSTVSLAQLQHRRLEAEGLEPQAPLWAFWLQASTDVQTATAVAADAGLPMETQAKELSRAGQAAIQSACNRLRGHPRLAPSDMLLRHILTMHSDHPEGLRAWQRSFASQLGMAFALTHLCHNAEQWTPERLLLDTFSGQISLPDFIPKALPDPPAVPFRLTPTLLSALCSPALVDGILALHLCTLAQAMTSEDGSAILRPALLLCLHSQALLNPQPPQQQHFTSPLLTRLAYAVDRSFQRLALLAPPPPTIAHVPSAAGGGNTVQRRAAAQEEDEGLLEQRAIDLLEQAVDGTQQARMGPMWQPWL